jgi:hypothetical protein
LTVFTLVESPQWEILQSGSTKQNSKSPFCQKKASKTAIQQCRFMISSGVVGVLLNRKPTQLANSWKVEKGKSTIVGET